MTEVDKNISTNPQNAGGSREKTYDVGHAKPPVQHQFSSTNQPDPSKSAETKRRKRFTRETLKELLNRRYTFDDASQVKAQLVKAYGEKAVMKMTVMEIATIMQMHKAIIKGDTQAFNSLMVNTFGQPKQPLEHSGPGGAPIQHAQTITQVIINNPHKKKPTE